MRSSRLPGFAVSLCLSAALAATFAIPAALASGAPAGPVLAWGDDSKGQLGDGTTNNTVAPVTVQLPAGVTVRQVSTGQRFSLALTSTGRVLAWGDNKRGELGNGSTTDSGLPVAVQLPRGVRVVAIAAGADHSLAVTSAGGVLAWGNNHFGELGNGTTTNSDVPLAVPLPAGVRVTAVGAGQQYSLALTAGGKVLAWGRGEFGRLGVGGHGVHLSPARVRLPKRTRVTAIAAGQLHGLALTAAGHILAWGYNEFGQLGNATERHSDIPVPVRLRRGTKVTAIAAGGEHSVALTTAGAVFAWGLNDGGQLCNSNHQQVNPHPVRVRLPSRTRVTAVSTGIFHTLILTAGGEILSCGNDASVMSSVPVRIHLGRGVIAVALSRGPTAFHVMVITRTAG